MPAKGRGWKQQLAAVLDRNPFIGPVDLGKDGMVNADDHMIEIGICTNCKLQFGFDPKRIPKPKRCISCLNDRRAT